VTSLNDPQGHSLTLEKAELRNKMLHNVSQQELVLCLAEELKDVIDMPAWAKFVKTGVHREKLPKNPDWWYIRAASILRVVFIRGPVGVSKLRIRYGGRQNRGYRPDKFALAGGKVIRTILQELEKAELIKQDKVANHKGRVITPKGGSLLAKATKAAAAKTKVEPVKKAAAPKKQAPAKEATEKQAAAKEDVKAKAEKVAKAEKKAELKEVKPKDKAVKGDE